MKTDKLAAFLKAKTALSVLLAAIVLVAVGTFVYAMVQRFGPREDPEPEISISATLEEIIRVSKLTTFSAVYNGVAVVHNQEEPELVDYYVSYRGRVKAGIDFEQVQVREDPEQQEIIVCLPPVEILDTPVDIGSLDFIWGDKKADTATVSADAYQAACEDIQAAAARQTAILDLAAENAENMIRGLTQPFLDQYYAGHTLAFERGEG